MSLRNNYHDESHDDGPDPYHSRPPATNFGKLRPHAEAAVGKHEYDPRDEDNPATRTPQRKQVYGTHMPFDKDFPSEHALQLHEAYQRHYQYDFPQRVLCILLNDDGTVNTDKDDPFVVTEIFHFFNYTMEKRLRAVKHHPGFTFHVVPDYKDGAFTVKVKETGMWNRNKDTNEDPEAED